MSPGVRAACSTRLVMPVETQASMPAAWMASVIYDFRVMPL